MMFDTTVVAAPHIQSGKLRAIAVSSAKRLASMPDVPTVAESGVPGLADYQVVSWQAAFVPAGTPAPIIERLHAEIGKILAQPEMEAKLKGFGMEPARLSAAPGRSQASSHRSAKHEGTPMSTAQFAAFQKAEVDKRAQVIKAAGVKVE